MSSRAEPQLISLGYRDIDPPKSEDSVHQLPPYAPELYPAEGVRANLDGRPSNLAAASMSSSSSPQGKGPRSQGDPTRDDDLDEVG
jgi:hypothetical protein